MDLARWLKQVQEARDQGHPKPCSSEANALGVDDAYEVLRLDAASRVGDPVIGFKSALTHKALQTSFQTDAPVIGLLFQSAEVTTGRVESDLFFQGRIETELGFTVAEPITAPVSLTELPAKIRGLMPMIELVDLNFETFPPALPDLIVHNAAAHQHLKGRLMPLLDPNSRIVSLQHNGVELHQEAASSVLGNQWLALQWLINAAVGLGFDLQPGQVLMTGAIGPVHPLVPGEYVLSMNDLESLQFQVF